MKASVVLINISHDPKGQLSFNFPPRIPMGPHFPLGVASLVSYLREKLADISLCVLDDQMASLEKIKAKIIKAKPELVGITCMFRGYKRALELARCAKEVGAKVLVGGHYATALAKEILTNRGPLSDDYCVDGVIKQDGERAFCEYVSSKPLREVSNLVYFEKGKIIENPVKLMNLNALPPLNFEYLNPHDYFKEYQRRFPTSKYKRPFDIYSQKGCRWRNKAGGGCLFCSIMYGKLRLRSPKIVWDEIERLVSDYGVDYIWDVADDFLSDKKWFKEFYAESHRRKKPFFKFQVRVDELIDENNVKMLYDLNAVQLFIGFESGDNSCLSAAKKGTSASFNKKALHNAARYGIGIRGYFVLGLPGETAESLKKTVKLAEEIIEAGDENSVVVPFFSPVPGSPSYRLFLKKTGKKYIGQDVIDWKEAIHDWVKYFSTAQYETIKKAQNHLEARNRDLPI